MNWQICSTVRRGVCASVRVWKPSFHSFRSAVAHTQRYHFGLESKMSANKDFFSTSTSTSASSGQFQTPEFASKTCIGDTGIQCAKTEQPSIHPRSTVSSSSKSSAAPSSTLDMADRSLSELVLENVLRAEVCQRLGLDYCCHGRQTLAEAVRAHGLNMPEVIAKLLAVDAELASHSSQSAVNLSQLRDFSLAALMDHIVNTHHRFIREQVPRISPLLDKIVRVHGSKDASLEDLRRVFVDLGAALCSHLDDEEVQFFPALRRLEQRLRRGSPADTGSITLDQGDVRIVREELVKLEGDHSEAAVALSRIRALTHDFQPPEYACTTVRTVFTALQQFDSDLRLHVAKENGLLHVEARETLERLGQPG